MNRDEETDRPDTEVDRFAGGEGPLRILPHALVKLLERGVSLPPEGGVRVSFSRKTGTMGSLLDRSGDFRLRGCPETGIWIRSHRVQLEVRHSQTTILGTFFQ